MTHFDLGAKFRGSCGAGGSVRLSAVPPADSTPPCRVSSQPSVYTPLQLCPPAPLTDVPHHTRPPSASKTSRHTRPLAQAQALSRN